ncbi:MAG TPA: hypothetical protein VGE45_04985 [Chloroflexia bacterium]|jgi:hypothetical protein
MFRATGHTSNSHSIGAITLLLLVALLSLLGGCSADCSWEGTAQAFVDENTNARWDEGEKPLPGAKFHVKDTNGNDGYGGEWVSDSTGRAFIAFFVSCNRDTDFVVYAEPPEGYGFTTSERLEAGSERGRTFPFGFIRKK